MRVALFVFSSAIALSAVSSVHAQTLVSRYEPTEPIKLKIKSVDAFQQNLNITQSPLAQSLQQSSAGSVSSIVAQYPNGNVSVKGPLQTKSGQTQFIVSARDESSGKPLVIKPRDLSVTNNTNTFEYVLTPLDEAKLPSSVIVVMDASGSMAGVIGKVQNAASYLFDQLPEHMSC